MISKVARGLAISLALAISAGAAPAQQVSENRLGADTDWSFFAADDPLECWAVSAPTETVNTRDGEVVAVRRGDILLIAFYRPGAGVEGQVAFTGGYPFASGSTVTLAVGDESYELFTEGEWAWPATPEDDARIVAAMRAGTDAVLTARSSRGTTTRDTFSLLGFTAMLEAAQQHCEQQYAQAN